MRIELLSLLGLAHIRFATWRSRSGFVMQAEYLKSFQKSLNIFMGIAEEQRRLSQSLTDAIGGYTIGLNLYTRPNPVSELSLTMHKQLLKSVGLEQSVNKLMKSISPKVPIGVVELIGFDIAANASALTALAQTARLSSSNLFVADQVARISDSYELFINDLIDQSFNSGALAIGHRLASQAIQFSGSAFAELAELNRTNRDIVELQVLTPSIFSAISNDIQEIESADSAFEFDHLESTIEPKHSARVVGLAGEIIITRYEINEISAIRFSEPIFKATSKSEYALGLLPLQVASSSDEFFALCERMYFFFYESSAKFVRLGMIDPNFPRVLDRIKRMRNHEHHDQQHGSPGDIKRNARQVGDHFEELIGKRYPSSGEDWTQAQITLMEELVAYQSSIRDQLLNQESPEN